MGKNCVPKGLHSRPTCAWSGPSSGWFLEQSMSLISMLFSVGCEKIIVLFALFGKEKLCTFWTTFGKVCRLVAKWVSWTFNAINSAIEFQSWCRIDQRQLLAITGSYIYEKNVQEKTDNLLLRKWLDWLTSKSTSCGLEIDCKNEHNRQQRSRNYYFYGGTNSFLESLRINPGLQTLNH